MAADVMAADSEPQGDVDLLAAIAATHDDPLAFVYFNWRWGEDGLKEEDGPDVWQIETLTAISDHIKSGGSAKGALQIAVASGHGIGKTALIAWIVIWYIATHPNPQIVVTANTMMQLRGKTWREVAKWNKMGRCAHLFKWTATEFYRVGHGDTWKAQAVPWSKDRPEAFQGAHEKYILMIFDEGSNVADPIWEAADGAMTTPGALWIVFGNPTRNTGRFRECFGKFKHRWLQRQIDSRTAKMADKKKIQQWIEDYGEDSDFVRIRVKGMFPRAASNQLIGQDLVDAAKARTPLRPEELEGWPKVLGVDVAREGDDQTVIVLRQHGSMKILRKMRERDLMQTAAIVGELIKEHDIEYCFVDMVGIGAGVVDRLKQLGFNNVIGVHSAQTAVEDEKYMNKRAEMWLRMRQWIKEVGCLENDPELEQHLIGVEYGFDMRNRYQLERKEDMKSRGLDSPDTADALALTFAEPVAARMREQKLTKVQKLMLGLSPSGNGSWMGR